jgi:transposase
MDKRVKYSLRQKLCTVRAVKSGKESCGSAARKIGSKLTTVRRWVAHYKQHGKAGLSLRQGSYSGQFKVRVIKYMLKNRLSLMQTATFFGIPQDHTVGKWLQQYKNHGAVGLLKETRGRPSITMAQNKKKDLSSQVIQRRKDLQIYSRRLSIYELRMHS